MTSPANDESGHPPNDSAELAELCDRYVEALQSKNHSRCEELLNSHPELQQFSGFLDSLEVLAPQPSEDMTAAPTDDSPTQASSSRASIDVTTAGNHGDPLSFGKYELLQEIGRGGMGVVYKARQTDLDRIVALKMILSSRLASPDEVRRFYAEARAAGGLRHARIVGIHEVGQVHGQHYFAMDFIEGECLADLAGRAPISPEQAAKLLIEVARAVHFLHEHGIVHRDLKPSNILLDDEGNPHVTDFGLAKVFADDSSQTQTGTIVGTPSYMAPEQATGSRSSVSVRGDVYSLGAILYELLTGRPPFKEANPLDTLVQVLEGEATLPHVLNRQIPVELEWICLKSLEKDPDDRYQSAAEFADDLDRFLKGEPVEAQPSSLWQRTRRWARREPALVSRLAALLVSAGIVQVKYQYNGTDLPFHIKIMVIFAVWAAVAFVFQQLLRIDRLQYVARFGWVAADAVLMTTMLSLAEPPIGPLLVGYPLLIVASGLFFQVRLVWFMTICTLLAYAALIVVRQDDLAGHEHYPVIYASVLLVLGFIVSFQIYRVRVLSRYFERPL